MPHESPAMGHPFVTPKNHGPNPPNTLAKPPHEHNGMRSMLCLVLDCMVFLARHPLASTTRQCPFAIINTCFELNL